MTEYEKNMLEIERFNARTMFVARIIVPLAVALLSYLSVQYLVNINYTNNYYIYNTSNISEDKVPEAARER